MYPPKPKISYYFDPKIYKLTEIMAIPFYNEDNESESGQSENVENANNSFFVTLVKELAELGINYRGCRNVKKNRRRRRTSANLPDLVCCHVQALQPDTETGQYHRHGQTLTDFSQTVSDQIYNRLSIKISIGIANTQIREARDQFGNEQKRRRTRLPAGNHHQTLRTIKFTLQIALPVTLIGLSLTFLTNTF